ncbi:MAG: hypothetical protein AAFY98_05360 [Verrucomicrobiota bacterium]
MDINDFKYSLKEDNPPAALTLALQALWWEANGDWDEAHELAQKAGGSDGDLVHAYLHRKQGDEQNAAYWYARAGRLGYQDDLDDEWLMISKDLLKQFSNNK